MSLNYDMTINGNYTFNYKTFKMKDNKFNYQMIIVIIQNGN